ncbi:MAG: type II toxin-antitoxin system RelE/ParE family toxin [Selenomonadaceae bacterium]|nr:type II toxin-antitoxin system RelE/ParE family toxin [Selenomonadaceae bacterium]
MESKTKQRIKAAIEGIPAGDIKPLQGYEGYYRLRVGGWRIIFTYPDSETLMIAKIAPRGGAYKGGF